MPSTNIGAGSCLVCFTSNPAPCWSQKTEKTEDCPSAGLLPPTRKIQNNLWLTALTWLSLVVLAFWRMNQQREDISQFLHYLCNFTFPINNQILKQTNKHTQVKQISKSKVTLFNNSVYALAFFPFCTLPLSVIFSTLICAVPSLSFRSIPSATLLYETTYWTSLLLYFKLSCKF